ncbi:uncharacterized protein A1O9_08845 [Exophiala aquamarina CBS 119918]|uniref:Kinesin-like protein n=1 Tax=Exophiala aquamarina CBS 119918 TaxID=1182545 RepID=A0A072P5S2_9EURO|nr:uncharacterized protein A1O9_08845 [Exophiala aquamarina CBS 119918]KEF55191.1 hypothetical protein A1O9_08845 [Exophiala aquamarina CBS 119918]
MSSAPAQAQLKRFKVFVRWRPLSASESELPEIERKTVENDKDEEESSMSISLDGPADPKTRKTRSWKSGAGSFTGVFEVGAGNQVVYREVVAPTLPLVLNGSTCTFFAYGHSGSGKTHTIVGYDYERDENLGLFLGAARELTVAIDELNAGFSEVEGQTHANFGVGLRLYELRRKSAFDLLNGHNECYIREGPDGKTHIRGETEMLEDGKVRVRPIQTRACWTFDQVRQHLLEGLQLRKTGSSTVHDQSSRTHAVLELEVVNSTLLEARNAVIERQSALVPVGKRATDIYLEEVTRSLIKNEDGTYRQNPDCRPNQARIDAAEAEKCECEARVAQAEADVSHVFASSLHSCLGGKFVFVDLAGSEYFEQGTGTSTLGPSPSPQERQEGRQINTDLFGLKEVLRARALGLPRIPFRSAPLTMALREHFLGSKDSTSAMILTVSPSSQQFSATTNTLKYGNLVGMASTDGSSKGSASATAVRS